MTKGQRYAVTKLMVSGGPHGDAEVLVTQVSRNKAELRCVTCDANVEIALPGGKVDMVGLAAMDEGVKRLHRSEA